jgi:hypothetical protein
MLYGQALVAGIFLFNGLLIALVLVREIQFGIENRRALARAASSRGS